MKQLVSSQVCNNLITGNQFTTRTMEKEINALYRAYKDGKDSRRSFLRKLALITGSSAAAVALFPVLEENDLKAAGTTGRASPELSTGFVKYPCLLYTSPSPRDS